MATLKLANLGLAFFVELAALAAFGFWGFHTGGTLLMKIVLGLGAPLLMAVFWGIFMAPNSKTRLSGAAYFTIEILIFGLAAVALSAAGQRITAIIFGVIAALNILLVILWRQK